MTTVHRLGPTDVALATRVHGEPVGYLVASSFASLSGERLAYPYDIEVLTWHPRRGLATMMVRELLSICRQAGVESIWVGSSLTNHAACELWRATGAQRDGDQYVEFTFDLDDAWLTARVGARTVRR